MISRSGKPLGRYFPKCSQCSAELKERRFLLDGELIIPVGDARLRSAADFAFIRRKAASASWPKETPAAAHDLRPNRVRRQIAWLAKPLSKRREALEKFYRQNAVRRPAAVARNDGTATIALGWLKRSGGALDGVVAKRLDQHYRSGERAMIKVKQLRTADCVVGGFRYAEKKHEVGSLLLGLYDDEGLLHHVGFTSGIPAKERPELTKTLEEADRGARLYRQRAGRAEPLEHRAHRPMGAAASRSWSSRSATTRSPAAASAMAPACSAGGPTRPRSNARSSNWRRSSSRPRSRNCSAPNAARNRRGTRRPSARRSKH